MLKVIPGNNIPLLEKQIVSLEWLISRDTNERDKLIHTEALKDIKARLKEIELLNTVRVK